MSFFEKLKKGLSKTSKSFSEQINNVLAPFRKVDEQLLEELEEVLIMADVGAQTSKDIIDKLRESAKQEKITEATQLKDKLTQIVKDKLYDENSALKLSTTPAVILVIGVNGVGKTTTIAKLANLLKNSGKKVVLAAGDTFRAAAIEQLGIWADRVGVEMIAHKEGSDPAAVIYDAISAGKKRGADVIICDTAGRLHNKKNLMAELDKINRVIQTNLPEADKEVLLVIDATTGMNALNQAKEFKDTSNITGLVLTKLDGSAKGGMVISVKEELNIPVKLVGVGEQMDDLQLFDSQAFAKALLE